MKNSKKTNQILSLLNEIEKELCYFSNDDHYRTAEFKEIREILCELALERKIDHARFAKKLKWLWKFQKDNEKTDKNN